MPTLCYTYHMLYLPYVIPILCYTYYMLYLPYVIPTLCYTYLMLHLPYVIPTLPPRLTYTLLTVIFTRLGLQTSSIPPQMLLAKRSTVCGSKKRSYEHFHKLY